MSADKGGGRSQKFDVKYDVQIIKAKYEVQTPQPKLLWRISKRFVSTFLFALRSAATTVLGFVYKQ